MTTVFDYARSERIGMPEAVFCEGKDEAALSALVVELAARPDHPTLFTRMSADQHDSLPAGLPLDYDRRSRTAFLNGRLPARDGRVTVLTAGTADLPVAAEAARTLEFMGVAPRTIADVGVAGIWRLLDRVPDLQECDLLIVVAGMDAAIVSVVGGLVRVPIIAVPTSVGYGVAAGGQSALHSMLSSCAQGVVVTNFDNGFGAACAALRMIGVGATR
jgi:NCAIR mutase (PurE)-related protein